MREGFDPVAALVAVVGALLALGVLTPSPGSGISPYDVTTSVLATALGAWAAVRGVSWRKEALLGAGALLLVPTRGVGGVLLFSCCVAGALRRQSPPRGASSTRQRRAALLAAAVWFCLIAAAAVQRDLASFVAPTAMAIAVLAVACAVQMTSGFCRLVRGVTWCLFAAALLTLWSIGMPILLGVALLLGGTERTDLAAPTSRALGAGSRRVTWATARSPFWPSKA